VVFFVRWRQDLALVDVVDAQRFEDLGLDEVPDPALGHHRDRHGIDDRADQAGIAHPGDAAFAADVGGNALQRHHRDGAGVFGDPRLLGGDDIHDYATLEHLGQSSLDLPGAAPIV